MGFVALGFGVCAGRGSVECVWSVVVMGVTGAVAVFLRYFETRGAAGCSGGGATQTTKSPLTHPSKGKDEGAN